MRVNQLPESECQAIPCLDRSREWVHWKSHAFPFASYCLVNEISGRVLALLEIYPQVKSSANKGLAEYLLRASSLLIQTLPAVFEEAFLEALSSAIALRQYLLEGEEKAKVRAQSHLTWLREALCFEDFFSIRRGEETQDHTCEWNTSAHENVYLEDESVGAGLR